MTWLAALRERLAFRLFRAREDEGMDEEIRFHLEMEAEANVRRGMSDSQARREAAIAFGGVEGHRERLRAERRIPVLEDLWSDLRHGLRSLRRHPGSSIVMIGTLALGIGASVGIFSVVRQLITAPVPFAEPERLVSIAIINERGLDRNPTYEDFRRWRVEAAPIGALVGLAAGGFTLGDETRTTYANAFGVTEGFFEVIGIPPLLGRTFAVDDHRADGASVVLLSQRVWEREFGADPSIVGRAVRVQGQARTIVGVVAAEHGFPAYADLWIPLLDTTESDGLYVDVYGRLARGRTVEEIVPVLETVQRVLDADRPAEDRARGVSISPFAGRFGIETIAAATLLRGAVLLLLVIGIANAAGLLLARGVFRNREIALLSSLGASRSRIARQFVAESAVIAVAAGVLGVGVAYAVLQLVRVAIPFSVSRQMLGWDHLRIDAGALALAIGLAGAAAIVTGLAPALRAARRNPATDLQERTGTASLGRRTGRLTRTLLAGEVALALTLLLTAALLTRGLLALVRADLGFRTADVYTAQWALPTDSENPAAALAFQDRLLESVEGRPGVLAAGIASHLPTAPFGTTRRFDRADVGGDRDPITADWRPVTPGYMSTVGLELRRGRGFTEDDGAGTPPAIVVDESLVATAFDPSDDPVGRVLTIGDRDWTIVGVVGNARNPGAMDRRRPTIYAPQKQSPTPSGFLAIRATPAADGLSGAVREIIWDIDPGIAVGEITNLADLVADERYTERAMATMVGAFAGVALLITLVSLSALVTHSAARRRRAIGIELALGARPERVVRKAIGRGMSSVAAGILLGLLLSSGVGRLLAGFVYGIRPLDPVVFTLVPGGLLALSLLASYLPARRAAKLDPMIALRSD